MNRNRPSRHTSRPKSLADSTDAGAAASPGACGELFNDCKPHPSTKYNDKKNDSSSSVKTPVKTRFRESSRSSRKEREREDYAVYPTKTVDRLGVDSFTYPYQCESTSTDVVYKDHPTLPHHSNAVRYQASNLRIFQQDRSQIVLTEHIVEQEEEDEEEDGSGILIFGKKRTREITVKKVDDAALVDYGLKSVYVLICVMFASLLFISCVQIILFLLVDAVPNSNDEDYPKQDDVVNIVAAVLSLPGLVHGFSSMMAIASAFTVDNWRGNRVLNAVSRDFSASKDIGAVIFTEWLSFFVFILVPAGTMIISLFLELDDWWEYTLIAWYATVFIFWAYYATAVLRYETKTCLDLVRKTNGCDSTSNLFCVVKRAILLRQMNAYSGYLSSMYIIHGDQDLPKAGNFTLSRRHIAERATQSIYTKLTLTACCSRRLYTQLDMPVPMKSLEDLIDTSPMITSKSWSLDKLFCRSGSQRSVLVLDGPAAVTLGQKRSSLAFSVIAHIVVLLLFISLSVWLDASVAIIIVGAGLITLTWIPSIKAGIKTSSLYSAVTNRRKDTKRVDSRKLRNEEEVMNQSETIYQVFERSRVSIPCDGICWSLFVVEVSLLFFLPLVIFFYVGNIPVAVLFLVVSGCSGIRRFLNPTVILKEMGSFNHLTQGLWVDEAEGGGNRASAEAQMKRLREDWVPKSRATKILGNISNGGSLRLWRFIFWALTLVAAAVAVSGIVSSGKASEQTDTSINQQLHGSLVDFEYSAKQDAYPMCNLPAGFRIPQNENSLSDMVYLSNLAYSETDEQTQYQLDKWFGAEVAVNQVEIVQAFKDAWGDTPLHYKLIDFSNDSSGYAVVSIRGAVNLADSLNGLRLWSPSGFSQMVQAIMPLGEIWAPILKKMVTIISFLEMHSIKEAAVYEEMNVFVQTLINSGEFTNIILTGHGEKMLKVAF